MMSSFQFSVFALGNKPLYDDFESKESSQNSNTYQYDSNGPSDDKNSLKGSETSIFSKIKTKIFGSKHSKNATIGVTLKKIN